MPGEVRAAAGVVLCPGKPASAECANHQERNETGENPEPRRFGSWCGNAVGKAGHVRSDARCRGSHRVANSLHDPRGCRGKTALALLSGTNDSTHDRGPAETEAKALKECTGDHA